MRKRFEVFKEEERYFLFFDQTREHSKDTKPHSEQ